MGECKALRDDGQPCGSRTRGGEEYCLWHSKERKAEADAVRALGGIRRRVTNKSEYPGAIENAPDLMRTINLAIQDAWAMEPGERRMRSLAPLLRLARETVQDIDTDQRLLTLEAMIFSGQKKTD